MTKKQLKAKIATLEKAIDVIETLQGTDGLIEGIEDELMHLQVELHSL